MANAKHSAKNPDWQTPASEITLARLALGGSIDFDPFTCAQANLRVQATEWCGLDHPDETRRSGYNIPWTYTSIYENHPGKQTKRAWTKTCAELTLGHFERLIWMGFSTEQICILSNPSTEPAQERWARGVFVPTDFSLCFLRKRIAFVDGKDPTAPPRPAHSNFILGIGIPADLFDSVYSPYGQTIHGPLV